MADYIYKNTSLYYEAYGEGIPFLLIHGWALDHRFLKAALEPCFAECKTEFKRIYIDVPGMGISEPGDVKNGDGILDVLINFMDDLFPNERFYVGGNSFGAHLSRGLMAKYPNRVIAALLLCPSAGVEAKLPKSGSYYQKDDEFLAELSPKEKAEFTCMNANLTREAYERYKSDVLASVRANDNNEFMCKKLKGKFGFDIDAMARKNPFSGPVMILLGRCDTAVGYEDQFKWLDMYPHASYAVMDGAGHNMGVDRPELFEGFIKGFLNSL